MYFLSDEKDTEINQTTEIEIEDADFPTNFISNKNRKRKISSKLDDIDTNSNKIIRPPKNKNHIYMEENIFMGFFSQEASWFPCRVVGVGSSGMDYSLIEFLGYGDRTEVSNSFIIFF